MAHFAQVDPDTNMVIRVVVVHDDYEHRGQEFLADDLDLGGTWIQCSYNTRANVHKLGGTPLRYNFPGAGHHYDPVADAFYTPQQYSSWALDENFKWQPPTPKPGHGYVWRDELEVWGLWASPTTEYPGDENNPPFYRWTGFEWVEVEE